MSVPLVLLAKPTNARSSSLATPINTQKELPSRPTICARQLTKELPESKRTSIENQL